MGARGNSGLPTCFVASLRIGLQLLCLRESLMANEPAKTMGSGCLGGLIGAFLGVVIGGFVGAYAHTKSSHPIEVPMPAGGKVEIGGFLDTCGAFFGGLLGSAIGGIIGGIGGSVLGAGLATKAPSKLKEESPSVKGPRPANAPEPPTESPDAELARLKERISELEAKERKDDPSKEESRIMASRPNSPRPGRDGL